MRQTTTYVSYTQEQNTFLQSFFKCRYIYDESLMYMFKAEHSTYFHQNNSSSYFLSNKILKKLMYFFCKKVEKVLKCKAIRNVKQILTPKQTKYKAEINISR